MEYLSIEIAFYSREKGHHPLHKSFLNIVQLTKVCVLISTALGLAEGVGSAEWGLRIETTDDAGESRLCCL